MPKKNFFADDYGVQISSGIARPVEVFIDDVYPQQYTPLPIYNPKFYQMPENPIEQPAYPVQPIYATPTPEYPTLYAPLPVYQPKPKFQMPIEQPAYPEYPTLYAPLPVYEPKPILTVEPVEPPPNEILTVEPEPKTIPIDNFVYGVVEPVKQDVQPVKPVDSTFVDDKPVTPDVKVQLPETKPVSKNLTPYVYAGLGIVVILLVARMVTKKG